MQKDSKYYYGGIHQKDSYRNVLSILSAHDSLHSVKTSSLPLAQFWGVAGLTRRTEEFRKYLKGVDLVHASKYFEFPTAVKKGIGKASMTDLMMFTGQHCIALEAKYTEYSKDKEYEPESVWNKGDEKNKNAVLDGWLEYIGKSRKEIVGVGHIPYQLIHRIASAYASREYAPNPVVVYQLFYDKDTKIQDLNHFVDILAGGLQMLNLEEMMFLAVKTRVDIIPPDLGAGSSEYYLRMASAVKKDREVFGNLEQTEALLYKAAGSLKVCDLRPMKGMEML